MRYTVYKITNTLNGKFYIGKHQTKNPNDSYFGSGCGIKSAIKTHGKHNFVKEVIFDFASEKEMNDKETELVTYELVNDPLCYNFAVGGEGGPHFTGKTHSKETLARIKQSLQSNTEALEKLRKVCADLGRSSKGRKYEGHALEKLRLGVLKRESNMSPEQRKAKNSKISHTLKLRAHSLAVKASDS